MDLHIGIYMVRASMLVGYVMDSAIKRLIAGGALMSGGRDLFAKCFAVALIMCAIGSIRCLELDSAGAAESRVGSILSRVEQASLTGSAGFQALETDGWGFETYVGYGSLLSISTEASWENEAPGLFELAGWAVYSDVVAISCREDLGEERMTRLPSEPDGWFSGTVWFVDGPGRYSLSVATRPPGKSSYIVVCSFCVRNVSCEIPLVPVEYVGYGYDLTIDFPRQESNTVTDVLHVRGWSRYGRVRATVQNLETGEIRTYYAQTRPDGTFEFPVPLDVGYGPCEVIFASRQIDAETWQGAAAYRLISEEPPLYMTQPAYQRGSILATGRFRVRGVACGAETVILETSSCDEDVVYRRQEASVVDDRWEAWIDLPEGEDVFRLCVGRNGSQVCGTGWEANRSYTVATVAPRPDPAPTEPWLMQSLSIAIQELAASIVDGIHDPYERVRALHDWVAANIVYDIEGARSGRPGPGDAITTLKRRQAVCLGYSNLLAALLRAAGCRVWVVIGNADNGISVLRHAWNEVEVEGRILSIDATWDSGCMEKGVFVRRLSGALFDPSPELLAFSHFAGI